MTQPDDKGTDRPSGDAGAESTSGPDRESDPTTQADAGMSGAEPPGNVEPHAEPAERGPEDEQPPERGRHDRPADDVAAAGTIEEREAISTDRDAVFRKPE